MPLHWVPRYLSQHTMGQEVYGASLGTHMRFASSPEPPDNHWSTASPVSSSHRSPFPDVKRPGRDSDHSPSTTAEVKNKWSYNPKPHTPLWLGQGKLYHSFCLWRVFPPTNWIEPEMCTIFNPGRKIYCPFSEIEPRFFVLQTLTYTQPIIFRWDIPVVLYKLGCIEMYTWYVSQNTTLIFISTICTW
jgi:hypothetical protein